MSNHNSTVEQAPEQGFKSNLAKTLASIRQTLSAAGALIEHVVPSPAAMNQRFEKSNSVGLDQALKTPEPSNPR